MQSTHNLLDAMVQDQSLANSSSNESRDRDLRPGMECKHEGEEGQADGTATFIRQTSTLFKRQIQDGTLCCPLPPPPSLLSLLYVFVYLAD